MNTPKVKVRTLQCKLSCAAKQSSNRKFGALYDKIYRMDVLMVSWNLVRKNHGVPGVDRQDFEHIEEKIGVGNFLMELQNELRTQTYNPQPVMRCWIDKPGKAEKRPLGIPVIKDRVAQMAAKIVIEPIFETNFLPSSHGFRPNKSCHTAINEIQRLVNFQGYKEVIDADIVGCFNNINHTKLLRLMENRISDKRVLRLIQGWLKSGVMENGVYFEPDEMGTPQGGVISPLLSNIYLHSFDKMFAISGIQGVLIRYADDFVVLVKNNAERALKLLKEMLKRLDLQMHPEKTRIVNVKDGFDFLGIHFRTKEQTKKKSRYKTVCALWPSQRSMKRIKQKIKDKIGRRYFLSLEELIKELNPIIRGWNNYQTRSQKHPEPVWFSKLNWFVKERIRIFLKRKYEDPCRGFKRVENNRAVKCGLLQFGRSW